MSLIGKNVVVRSSQSGVWLGTLDAQDGETVTLTDARRAWRWTGAASCSGLAVRGPKGGNICESVAVAQVLGVCEVLLATDEAVAAWKAVPAWKA